MAAPVRGELYFWDNRLRWFPAATLSAAGAITSVTANIDTTYPARVVTRYAYTVTAAVGQAYHEYVVEHADEGDNDSADPYVQGYSYNNGVFRCKMWMRLSDGATFPTTQATRTKFFHLRSTSGASMMNLGVYGAATTPTVRCFTDSGTGGASTSKTFTPTEFRGANLAAASWVEVDVVWKSATAAGGNGICKVWWNDTLVVNVSNHNCDATPARFWLGLESAGNQSGLHELELRNWRHDDDTSTDALAEFQEYSENGCPGVFWVADVSTDTIVVSVQSPPTRFGWSNVYALVQYDNVQPISWNGSPSETSAQELTAANGGLAHFVITGLDADQFYSFKVVFQDDAATPSETVTQDIARGPIYTNPADSDSKILDIWVYFCTQQDGFSHPHYGLKLIEDRLESNATHRSILWWAEDVVYCDSRDVSGNVDVYALPGNDAASGSLAATSALGLIDLHRENLTSEYWQTLRSKLPTRFGYGDHQFHNSYNPNTWPGSGTAAPAPFAHITRGNVHSRGRACIEALFTPAMLNKGDTTETYRTERIGPVLIIYLDLLRYRTTSTIMGATQLAWAIAQAEATDARHVVFAVASPMGDMIWKASQDVEDDTDWQDDRNDLFDAVQANPSVETFGILAGDHHIIAGHNRFKNGYTRTWSKCVGEFILGPGSNNMLSTAILKSVFFPDAPGTPMTDADFDAMESKAGVLFFDRLTAEGDTSGSPGYLRVVGRVTIDPSEKRWRIRAYNARYLSAPVDPLILDLYVAPGGSTRLRNRADPADRRASMLNIPQ